MKPQQMNRSNDEPNIVFPQMKRTEYGLTEEVKVMNKI
jgi:hypothetical protein